MQDTNTLKPSDDQAFLTEISRLYYKEDLSQSEIAKKYAISRSFVSKLLKKSRDLGLVSIHILEENEPLFLSNELKQKFPVRQVIVVPSGSPDAGTADTGRRVGEKAAEYLESLLQDNLRIDLEWGTSLYHMIEYFTPLLHYENIEVIQMHGVIESPTLDIEGFSLVQKLAKKLGARTRVLQAPMMIEDKNLRDRLISERKISETLEAAKLADIACIGIGTNQQGTNVLTQAGYLSREESHSIKERGGTAMVSGWFIDLQGNCIETSANDRIIGLHPERLKRIPTVIAVAYGEEKCQAIQAALRGGYVDVLVTDTQTAKKIVAQQQKQDDFQPDRDQLIHMYRKMYRTRIFEERIDQLFQQKSMHGTTHLCIGQEASSVIPGFALKQEDLLFGTHRGHGHALGKGADLKAVMAEMFGKETGCARGRGGSMHLVDEEKGLMGGNGVVAGAMPIAVGAALGCKLRGERRIAAVFFGDGAMNEGAAHEALNLAAIWKLPVVFLCENNQYGLSRHISDVMKIDDLATRIHTYGIPCTVIDGNDAISIYTSVVEAREKALEEGPVCIVMDTYRVSGHSKSDTNAYRSEDEIAYWRNRCPVSRMRMLLQEAYGVKLKDLEQWEAAEEESLEEAEVYARESGLPLVEELERGVYAHE